MQLGKTDYILVTFNLDLRPRQLRLMAELEQGLCCLMMQLNFVMFSVLLQSAAEWTIAVRDRMYTSANENMVWIRTHDCKPDYYYNLTGTSRACLDPHHLTKWSMIVTSSTADRNQWSRSKAPSRVASRPSSLSRPLCCQCEWCGWTLSSPVVTSRWVAPSWKRGSWLCFNHPAVRCQILPHGNL